MKSLQTDFKEYEKQLIEQLGLPDSFAFIVSDIYFPLANKIFQVVNKSEHPILVSINGAQGTGKSTLTQFLQAILSKAFEIPTTSFSLDDFYLTRAERKQLAEEVHPLFLTRGVPGTHDIQLLSYVVRRLLAGNDAVLPRFDKSIDDRYPSGEWLHQKPVKLILFEGWCNNSPVQTENALSEPVNELEKKEDPDGTWRQYANQKLAEYHREVFSKAALTLMLQAPGFDCVYEWRQLQEDKLRTSAGDTGAVMSNEQVKRFIQHYERITRHTLSELPKLVDILLPMNKDHAIERIEVKNAG